MTCRFCAVFSKSRKVLFFLLFIFIFPVFNCQHTDNGSRSTKPCATLHSGSNGDGTSFSLNHHDQSVSLAEDLRASETGTTGWNVTGSVTVELGCNFRVCENKYFDGACHTLSEGFHLATDNEKNHLSNIASAECTCEEECKCSDIHVRKSSCGRVYLAGGCQTCNTLYFNLKPTAALYLPDISINNVTALRLRKGCTLTIWSEENFEGEETAISRQTVENHTGTIGSYECDCDDSLYEPYVPPLRPDNLPPLMDIPNSMDEVVKLLGNETYKFHPGIQAARQSYRSGKSPRNAYILVLGSSGAGKTSTINLLFDNPSVAKSGWATTTTSAIHEFRIPVAIDELGIANSELRVIDTPGLVPTRSRLGYDAQILASLDNFLSTHEELKDRLPNAVLIFHQFTDNTISGEGSSFLNMIRSLGIISKRYADDEYSNVIFVFSHFAAASETDKKRPDIRLERFKRIIEDYSLYPKPMHLCVAEAKAVSHEIPMVNGYHKLPNNEYYPRNLLEKLELAAEKGRDPIGLGVFRTAFRNTEHLNITSRTFHLLPENAGNMQKYMSYLVNSKHDVAATEVSQRVQTVWEENVTCELQKKFPTSLAHLQKALNMRHVYLLTDVPRTSHGILNLLRGISINAVSLILLEKGLGMRPPTFPQTVAGYGYNVFQDKPLTRSPFKLNELQYSEIGFMIPKSLTCKLKPDMKERFYLFENRNEYIQHRFKSLGLEGTMPVDRFTDEIKPGSNIRSLAFQNNSCSLSATLDYEQFEFLLNDEIVELTPEFENSVRSLPPLNQSDSRNVASWMQFFDRYGTHVVNSVHGGGMLQMELQSSEPCNINIILSMFDVVNSATELTSSSNASLFEDETSQTFVGGNSEYHTDNLGEMSITQAHTLLRNWRKSLKFTPAILPTKIQLKPISLIVRKLGENYVQEIDRAAQFLFNTEVIVDPRPKKEEAVSVNRNDELQSLQKIVELIQQQQNMLLNIILEMQAHQRYNEKRKQDLEEERHKERVKWENTMLLKCQKWNDETHQG